MKIRNLTVAALLASALTGTTLVATPAVADSSKTCNVSDIANKVTRNPTLASVRTPTIICMYSQVLASRISNSWESESF